MTTDDSDSLDPVDEADRPNSGANEPKQQGSWSRVVALFLGGLAVLIVASDVFTNIMPTQEALLVIQVTGVLGTAVAYSFIMGGRRAPWPDLDRLGFGLGQVVLMALAAIGLGLAANATMGLTVELFPGLEWLAERYRESMNELVLKAEGADRVLGILAICVAAPVCEESLFRGTLLQEKRLLARPGIAIAVNGLLFSMFHLNPIALLPLAVVGAFLAHLIVLTDSLWAAILGHAVFNGFNGVVLPELVPAVEQADVTALELFGGDLVLGAVPQFLLAMLLFGGAGGFFWWWLTQSVRRET